MSKAVSDMLGRLEGDLLALQGMAVKLRPPSFPLGEPNTTRSQEQFPAPPAPPISRQDYEFTKTLLAEIKGLAQSASDEIDKELKIPAPAPPVEEPPPPSGEPTSAPSSSGSGSAKTK